MGTDKRARQKELSRTRAEQARKAAANRSRRKRGLNIAIVVALLGAVVIGTTLIGGDDTASDDATTTTTPAVACPKADGSSERRDSFPAAPKLCIDPSKIYTAEVETTLGSFTIALDAVKATRTVNNFVYLARYHFYDGLTFHRIIKDFMFQGGDPAGDGTGGPGYTFGDELPQAGEYQKYSVAMANSGPDSNGSQFFVITGAQGVGLPPSYSLFGLVTDGTDVADTIGNVEVDGEAPKEPVTITKVTITEN